MNKFAIGGVGVFIILVLIHICKITWQTASLNAKQVEASIHVANLIRASQSYIKENNKLPQTTKDLSKYLNIVACAKDDPDFCKNEPYISHNDDEIKRWFSPSGNYIFEIQPYEGTFFILATPTGKIKQTGYGVKGFSGLAGGTKVIELKSYENNLEFDFTIENYIDKNPYREAQNREEKFLLCYKNAQSEKDLNLRTKKENKCQRERFSNYPKLRDSFKD